MRPVLFFWREVPVDVDIEMYTILMNHWGNKVYFISVNDELLERKTVGIVNDNFSSIILREKDNEKYVKQLVINFPDAIHVFAGVSGYTFKKWGKFCIKNKFGKLVVLSERPNKETKWIRIFAQKWLNIYRAKKYAQYINAKIIMGNIGVQNAIEYGWNSKIVFPFMYCPNMKIAIKRERPEKTTKFLYLGRFSYKYKGLNVLMGAIDKLNNKGWECDFVGGYGDNIEDLKSWALKYTNVRILPVWQQNEIVNNMSLYDCVIIPSEHDGWNLNANYAIYAGIPIIISDNAGSDDLVVENKNGFIFKNGDIDSLCNAMERVINASKTEIAGWKSNAILIREFITPDIVSKYLISIIDYACLNSHKIPVCPWGELNKRFI